jgi:hypothetical protein
VHHVGLITLIYCDARSAEHKVCPVGAGGACTSVGIATGYGLDGPGIESRWGRDFSDTSRSALGLTQPSVQWVPGLSWGQSGRGVVLNTHPLGGLL